MKILVVDDSVDSRRILRLNLENSGYEVIEACNGVEALEVLKKSHPDLIISDILMPEMDGFSLCREIKRSDDLKDIPLVFYSATYVEAEDKKLGMGLGASRFIIKPAEQSEFLDMIQGLLKNSSFPKPEIALSSPQEYDTLWNMYQKTVSGKLQKKINENRLYKEVFESANDGIALIDEKGFFWEQNNSNRHLFGFSSDDIKRKTPAVYMGEEQFARIFSIISDGGLFTGEIVCMTKSGEQLDIETSVFSVSDQTGEVIRYVGIFRDITERKKNESELRLAADIFENSIVGVMMTDTEGVILRVNTAILEITGYSEEELIGKTSKILQSGRHTPDFYDEMWSTISLKGGWQGEICDRGKDGNFLPLWGTITEGRDLQGFVSHYVFICSDLSEQKGWEEKVYQASHYDSLTGLPNRLLFKDRLHQALTRAFWGGIVHVAVLLIDIDRFKSINNSMGHNAGDQFLRETASRLQGCVAKTDTLVRLGGDEFMIVIPDLSDRRDAVTTATILAEKALSSIAKPFWIEKHEINVTASIGVVLYPENGDNVDNLMKNVDSAMYHAKEKGRGNFQFYSEELNSESIDRLDLESHMRHALERDEFFLFYQPQFNLKTGLISGAEALIRWEHSDRGVLEPKDFIPMAEETGLIVPIGEWVLRTACRQRKVWADAGYTDFRVAVNLSALQLQRSDFVETVDEILKECDLSPDCLELEITESMLMQDVERTIITLKNLHEMGIYLSVDDFGTGYSSLSYLKRFPLHALKIDRSFVADIPGNDESESIVTAIITMAHSLKYEVIAEGVETVEQERFLRNQGCAYMQGFLTSRPVNIEHFEQALKRNREKKNE